MQITVHHLNHSRSQRILWLLEELEVPYEVKHYERSPKTLFAPASLRAIHPLGKSPVVTVGNLVLAESGAIIEYLVEHFGKGRFKPTAPEDAQRYIYWLHFAEGSAMPPLLLKLVFSKILSNSPFFLKPLVSTLVQKVSERVIDPDLNNNLEFMESALQKTTWFTGNSFSAADIQMSFPVEASLTRAGNRKQKKLQEFVTRIHERPAYQRALVRGGPFEILS